jgi:hypothetical protein
MLLIGVASVPSSGLAGDAPQEAAVAAKVIEITGSADIGIPGEEARALRAGDYIAVGENVTLSRGSSVMLAIPDKTLREFTGPTTLAFGQNAEATGGKVVANLTAAVADMLFGMDQQGSEAIMATRSVVKAPKTSVPVLTRPVPGERLIDAPREFRWVGLQGVQFYRVSVYSSKEMLWQTTTSESKAGCPKMICEFKPDETYYWAVEALVGDATLRSEAAEFAMLSEDDRSMLEAAMGEAVQATDARMAMLLKVRLCMDARAYGMAEDVLDRYIEEQPSEHYAYVLRADLSEKMGLMEDAVRYYRKAIATPPAE